MRIGFITADFKYILARELWHGAREAAEKNGAELVTLAGGMWRDREGLVPAAANVFELCAGSFDGFVIWAGAVGQFMDAERVVQELRSRSNKPVVSVAMQLPGIHSLQVDNYLGMKAMIVSLIREQGYRRPAFVKGPEGHPEAEERFKAFRDALSECGLTLNKEWIAPGEFEVGSGRKAVRQFFENRRGDGPDLIVCVDDDSAIGVMQEATAQHLRIPEDFGLSGFDDIEDAQAMSPSLTSIGQPAYQMGARAVESLLEIIRGKSLPPMETIPAKAILRQSTQRGVAATTTESDPDSLKAGLKAMATSRVSTQLAELLADRLPVWNFGDSAGFRKQLDALMDTMAPDQAVMQMFDLVLTNDHVFLPRSASGNCGADFAKVIIAASLSQVREQGRLYLQRLLKNDRYALAINSMLREFDGVSAETDLLAALERSLPGLDISGLVLLRKTAAGYRLVYQIGAGTRSLPDAAKGTAILDLCTPGKPWVIKTLVFHDEDLGMVALIPKASQIAAVDTLAWQFAAVLNRIDMIAGIKERESLVAQRNQSLIDSVRPMLAAVEELSALALSRVEAIQKVSGLTGQNRDSLDLTNQQIVSVVESVRDTLSITRVIDDISESVNVLAINAAIESSHAGSFGRGFSVIAKEIRKLSDSTAYNSREISKKLTAVMTDASEASKRSGTSKAMFNEIEAAVTDLTGFLEQVVGGMNRLAEASRHLMELIS